MNRRGAGIFNFFRTMASSAIRRCGFFAQQRFHASFGMATGANCVIPKCRESAVVLKVMAEGAIRAESRAGIHSFVRINVLRM